MRKFVFAALGIAGLAICPTAGLSMGSNSGTGYGGGSQDMSGSQTQYDDYAAALRLIKHQQYADAIPHLEAALEKRPNNADILNYLGYTHRMVGAQYKDAGRDAEFKVSLDYYMRALAIDPNHRGVHEYLGELYLQMNDLASAKNEMATLETLCPSGCDERDTLSKSMAAYVPPSSAAQPATAAQ